MLTIADQTSSTPHVNAPCDPPPCSATFTLAGPCELCVGLSCSIVSSHDGSRCRTYDPAPLFHFDMLSANASDIDASLGESSPRSRPAMCGTRLAS